MFLFRFTQFVDWPDSAFPSPTSPLVIGVLGRDPFGEFLEAAVRNERVRNRPLRIERYQRAEEIKNCQILFISASESGRLEKDLAELRGRSIVTVSDLDGFVLRGGTVQFLTEQNRIRFRINVKAARAAKVQISSRLLELAEVVNAQKE